MHEYTNKYIHISTQSHGCTECSYIVMGYAEYLNRSLAYGIFKNVHGCTEYFKICIGVHKFYAPVIGDSGVSGLQNL